MTKKDLRRVVSAVNTIRKARGAKPIKKLPKGRPSACFARQGKSCGTKACVIANALVAACSPGGIVAVDGAYAKFYSRDSVIVGPEGPYADEGSIPEDSFELPSVVRSFITAFDDELIPELIASYA